MEVKDGLGLERFEPLGNVEIVELPGYGYDTDVSDFFFKSSFVYILILTTVTDK